ncbi:hypothetical protein Glove_54g150 [Diversispora epigaea]|uniref:Uncharacterized protein n=1 Tax=Diversispora epigaea TaxID=1348612 RepID=A0A397JDF4_9GLOM|nr:hypothetical protein Glove_54g150 [Diversispora epigaea]
MGNIVRIKTDNLSKAGLPFLVANIHEDDLKQFLKSVDGKGLESIDDTNETNKKPNIITSHIISILINIIELLLPILQLLKKCYLVKSQRSSNGRRKIIGLTKCPQ